MKRKLPFIVFEITSHCNLNCRYCYNIWKRPESKTANYNSYQKAKKTMQRLFKIAEVDHVTMSGGEPFLCERFSELVLYCRMKHKSVTIISNGNTATKKDYKQLIDLGVSLFEFPIHSADGGTHDYLTQVKGSWQKSVQSVKNVLELGGNVVCVIVITKANHTQIKESLLFIKNLGVNRIMLNRFNIGGEGILEQKNLLLNHQELNEAYKIANEIGFENNLTLSSNVCTPICVVNPEKYPHIRFSSCAANVTNMPLTMGIDGNMRLCNHSPVVVGNIFKDNLDDIFSSDYAKSWKEIIPDYCIDCDKYFKCFGGCRAASEQLGRGLNKVDPLVNFF